MTESRLRLLVATRNRGKLQEFRRLLAESPYDVVGLDELGISTEVEETGNTFDENARLKAEAYLKASGELTLADDSGLEVGALDGAPGVYSARYGGEGLDDRGRVTHLLNQLAAVPGWKRTARFRAVLALAGPGVPGGVITTEGVVEGAIAHQPIGENGFGYDPVFWIPSLAKTTAELSPDAKDAVSHRGAAAREMAGILLEMTPSQQGQGPAR
ncbi:MAG: RdgB/HAM1 family non-canonical purine NTP pyrophosphatase [Dehalococcoidia bacterium]